MISAGVIPTLDCPGVIIPGQFGPIIRQPFSRAAFTNSVESCTGIPSVITTISGIPASTASNTAPLAKRGGTNTTETFAPSFSMASFTVPNTGTETVPALTPFFSAASPRGTISKSTVCPAFLGLVPPTTLVPAPSINRVCLRPSEPVMPCTTIRAEESRNTDILFLLILLPILRSQQRV